MKSGKKPADLAHVAGFFRHAFFPGVQFFQNYHRNVNFVFVETKNSRRVMHQHVGIEDKNPASRWIHRGQIISSGSSNALISKCFHGLQDFGNMTLDPNLAPFLAQYAKLVEKKSAALNTDELAAVPAESPPPRARRPWYWGECDAAQCADLVLPGRAPR